MPPWVNCTLEFDRREHECKPCNVHLCPVHSVIEKEKVQNIFVLLYYKNQRSVVHICSGSLYW